MDINNTKSESAQYLPTTIEELFRFLTLMVQTVNNEGVYVLPWVGWIDSLDARKRLLYFEDNYKGKIIWKPFNNSEYNEGPMTLNSCPGRAMIERVTNGWDACIELKALEYKGQMPSTPQEAAKLWFDLDQEDFVDVENQKKLNRIATDWLELRAFCSRLDKNQTENPNNVVDVRDYGIGMTAGEMATSILTLNHGNKVNKHYLTGKHGQGASSTYQYADMTLIASRKHGSKTVAFTIVERDFPDGKRVPTYRYLTLNDQIPVIEISEKEFRPGTLVRHIRYAGRFQNPFGHESYKGLLDRSLAKPLIPIPFYFHYLYQTTNRTKNKLIVFETGYEKRDICRGTINVLDRQYAKTLKTPANEPQDDARVLYKAREVFHLGKYNFGSRTGYQDAGYVVFSYWVAGLPTNSNPFDAMKHWVLPGKPILFTLDGQTNTEEDRSYLTAQEKAGLWAIGKTMAVQVDCDHLSNYAKYDMFTSTREQLKDTSLKSVILDELVRRLKRDEKLKELQEKRASISVSQRKEDDTSLSERLKKYLRNTGLSFASLIKNVKSLECEEELRQGGKDEKGSLLELPIESLEPPTFIRWRFRVQPCRMYSGQKYSWVFETNAPPSYWNPDDVVNSRIQILTHNVQYIGGGEMRGGRVRCHFLCPKEAKVGSKGMIQVTLKISETLTLPPQTLEILVVPERVKKETLSKESQPENGSKDGKGFVRIPVSKAGWGKTEFPLLKPEPVHKFDPNGSMNGMWSALDWPFDPSMVGFSLRVTSNVICLYYNADLPAFVEIKRKMAARKLETIFQDRFEIHILMLAIFQLNHGIIDEEKFTLQETKDMMHVLTCASAESAAYAAKIEIDLELKLGKDDWTSEAPDPNKALSSEASPVEKLPQKEEDPLDAALADLAVN